MSTPVQRQYQDLKDQNPDAILFFRLGDFYEMFFEDAKVASRVLGITLTARHRGTDNEMPMAGMPHHAHKEYLQNLVSQGYKVAIAEQVEDEEGRITREVVRVVTPGTSQEEHLDPNQPNFLAGVVVAKDSYAIAVADLSTGEFRTTSFEDEVAFFDELYRLNPKEILLESSLFDDEVWVTKLPDCLITPRPEQKNQGAKMLLQDHFGLPNLEPFGLDRLTDQITASALVLQYLQDTQKTDLTHIQKIVSYTAGDYMQLDQQTLRHLEVFEPMYREETNATLWSVFQRPMTAMGGRTLRMWMARPLLHRPSIDARLDGVAQFLEFDDLRENLQELFRQVVDLERLMGRICTGQANPRDFAFLRDSLALLPQIGQLVGESETAIIKDQKEAFEGFEKLIEKLESQLIEQPPIEITKGGVFKDGFNEELDELRNISRNAQDWLNNFLEQQKEATGIPGLRVKFSKNFGFCLEVSKGQADKAPEHWNRRQTLVNAERFTTPELADYESNVLSAEEKAFALEYQLFTALRESVIPYLTGIQAASRAIGTLDGLLCLARTSRKFRWNRPTITDEVQKLNIQKGRHPVVEKLSTETFIANNCDMGAKSQLHLITGPNMAGKSTYLRQNALIILLGQMGSYVPAQSAEWGICDRIFTRVGASDNLAAGKSTFFVEMLETAHILNAATERSFIILDEIGRGTSTFDGISLAWAIVEFLHNQVKAKTLFATHYHELIDLADQLPRASNFHVSVTQNESGIVFLRQIKKGGISDSFGIDVAKLAGIPKTVIANAQEVMERLESDNLLSGKPNLFEVPKADKSSGKDQQVLDFVSGVDPDDLTPKKALELWYELKKSGVE